MGKMSEASWKKNRHWDNAYERQTDKMSLLVQKVGWEYWEWKVRGTQGNATGWEESKLTAKRRADEVAELLAKPVNTHPNVKHNKV